LAKKIIKFDNSSELDFLLAGIVCPYKDYRLCFEINRALKLSFARKEDHTLYLGKPGAEAAFSFYKAINRFGEEFYVLGNKSIQATLIPEKPAFDFFMIVKNYGAYFDFNEICNKIKQIEMVSAVSQLRVEELKSADNFIFD
jgi:hypothetical protein